MEIDNIFGQIKNEVSGREKNLKKAKVVERDRVKEKTIWNFTESDNPDDVIWAERMRNSFEPSFIMTSLDPVPVPGQEKGNLYVSDSFIDKDGNKQSSNWLNPKKWQPALDEFAKFAATFHKPEVQLLVSKHVVSERESVYITPVIKAGGTDIKHDEYSFVLDNTGRVYFGNEEKQFVDLGYLQPKLAVEVDIPQNMRLII